METHGRSTDTAQMLRLHLQRLMGEYLAEHGDKLRHLQLREVLAPPEVASAKLLVLADRTRKEVVRVHDHMHK
jgi:hypothetical protein